MDEALEQKIKDIDEKMPGMAKRLEGGSMGFYCGTKKCMTVDYKETDKWKVAAAREEHYELFWRAQVGIVVYAINKNPSELFESEMFCFFSETKKIWDAACDLYEKAQCGKKWDHKKWPQGLPSSCLNQCSYSVDIYHRDLNKIKITGINNDVVTIHLFNEGREDSGIVYRANLNDQKVEELGRVYQLRWRKEREEREKQMEDN